ncbi:MAG: riboflavin synthase [Actinomycetota bacterium]|nr:riboflavin synthase [Actinomycetota bacterium]
MFTGIVEERGRIVEVVDLPGEARRIRVLAPLVTGDARPGDSIAVNGVCLTVVNPAASAFSADIMKESLDRSTLGSLVVGDEVNLERALRVSDRLGGHIVSGHVDGLAAVIDVTESEHWRVIRFAVPEDLLRYLVQKGSVCLDGASLTVSAVRDDWLEVSLIPTTLAETTLGSLTVGDRVNVEVDVLAKYTEKLLSGFAR